LVERDELVRGRARAHLLHRDGRAVGEHDDAAAAFDLERDPLHLREQRDRIRLERDEAAQIDEELEDLAACRFERGGLCLGESTDLRRRHVIAHANRQASARRDELDEPHGRCDPRATR
jgi:hypothetical protein